MSRRCDAHCDTSTPPVTTHDHAERRISALSKPCCDVVTLVTGDGHSAVSDAEEARKRRKREQKAAERERKRDLARQEAEEDRRERWLTALGIRFTVTVRDRIDGQEWEAPLYDDDLARLAQREGADSEIAKAHNEDATAMLVALIEYTRRTHGIDPEYEDALYSSPPEEFE